MRLLKYKMGKTIAIAASLGILAGCVNFQYNYIKSKYGLRAKDAENIMPPGKEMVMPENAPSISQGFDPIAKEKVRKDAPRDHPGLDIVANVGTPVLAAATGKVIKSTYGPAFGHQVSILHDVTLDNKPVKTNYYHLKKRTVVEGQLVNRGEQIGTLGRTGALAAFPHLHFEVRERGEDLWEPMNPHYFWANGTGLVTCFNANRHFDDDIFVITYPVLCKPLPGVDG